jgi:hypothetical protein
METTLDTKQLNILIDKFMGLGKAEYKVSTTKDIHGNFVKEGDIINADGYKSDIESDEPYLHVVEYDKSNSEFGSNVYGDFDRLSMYKKIEVIAHVEDFRHLKDSPKWQETYLPLNDGGIGEIDYRTDLKALMKVYDKINTTSINDVGEVYMVIKPWEVYITEDGHNHIIHTDVDKVETDRIHKAIYETVVKFIEFYNQKNGIS